MQKPRPTVRWVLHEALRKGDKTTVKIHDPVYEYDIFKDKRVEIFLEEQPSSNDEIPVLNPTTTFFMPLALQEPDQQQAESSAAIKRPPSPSNSDTCIIMEIDPEMLGQGTFGACYKATIKKHRPTDSYEVPDKQFAFKQMNMACTPSSKRVWTDEANMLRKLNDHENIVKYLFSCTCTSISQEAGQTCTRKVAGIAMEKCPGKTLHSFLRSKIKITNKAGQPKQLIPTEELLQIFRQSADGLHYMKTNQIIHCDIKLDNVMWDEDGKKLKFIDFGLAFPIKQDRTYRRCGTPGYMAPECYDGKVDFYSDVWSLGIMMSCLLLQMMPYESNSEMVRINEEKRRRKEPLTEQEEEDYKQKKNKVIHEEIENFKQGKQMTSIEERLREAHKEDQKFLESYQPESVINSNVFRLLASRIADCLTREGTGRPEPQQIIKDCETSLEEIRPTGSSGETPQTETESKGMPNLTLLNQSTKPYNESTGREESVGNAAKEDEEEDPGRAAPEDSGEDF